MQKNGVPEVSKLERAGIIQTLLFLYINRKMPEITVNNLIDGIEAATDTVLRAIDYLIAEGLVEKEETRRFPFKHLLKLTDKGLSAAGPLVAVAQALKQPEAEENK